MEQFFISATGLSINYLPQYIADELGYFQDVGLQVKTDVPQPWTQVLKDIDSGSHHAACGGIWVPSIYIQHGVRAYKAFAKISGRCPMVLVARESQPQFNWRDLEGKTVLVPGDNGISPYMWLHGCAKEGGVNMEKIKFVHDFTNAMLAECFINGTWGDMFFTNPVVAAKAVSSGAGVVVCEMVKAGGPVPWSVYYAPTEMLEQRPDLYNRFTFAIQRAISWLQTHCGEDCQELLARNWPSMDLQQAIATVDTFRENGMWESAAIGLEETQHYAQYQVDAGTLTHPLAFEGLVDLGPFNSIIQPA